MWVSCIIVGICQTEIDNMHLQGNTPLHLAMESGHGDVAVLLIESGADRTRARFLNVILVALVD